MSGPLTSPETSAEWRNIQRMRAAIYRCGGCGACLNRAYSFGGRGVCKVDTRTFPLCLATPGIQFEIDTTALDRIIKPAEKAA